MRFLLVLVLTVMTALPAAAADWSFYGSQRVGTWYTQRDYGDGQTSSGQGDDAATQMYFQGNSRLGAKVKADKVSGQIELALGSGGDGSSRRVVGHSRADVCAR